MRTWRSTSCASWRPDPRHGAEPREPSYADCTRPQRRAAAPLPLLDASRLRCGSACPRTDPSARTSTGGLRRTPKRVHADVVAAPEAIHSSVYEPDAVMCKDPAAGFRTIAARFGRPESTVRRWLRAAPGAARAVAVPAGCGPGRAGRPGAAGPAGAAADHARTRVEPAGRRGRAVPGLLRKQRPGLVADGFLCARAAPGGPAANSQLKFAAHRALPCPAPPVTVRRNPGPRMPYNRHLAERAVTLPTSTCILDDGVVRRLSDGQQPCSGRPATGCR